MEIQYCTLMVKDKPYCYWDINIKESNLRFIDGIEPSYFARIADMYYQNLGGENDQVAAMSLRMAYFHGLETLFSLLCATMQSPYCVYGWLHHYETGQLKSIVTSIQTHREIPNVLGLEEYTWLELSRKIHQFELEDKEKEEKIKSSYGKLWAHLAKEFLYDDNRVEYNHIKHGFRVRSGGFHLSIGEEKEYGVPANPQDMKPLGGSKYGTSFYIPVEFQSEDKEFKRLHYQIEENNINWEPYVIGIRLKLISESINNILSFLKIGSGVAPTKVEYVWPPELEIFDDAWKVKGGPIKFKAKSILTDHDIQIFTPEELLNLYGNNAKKG